MSLFILIFCFTLFIVGMMAIGVIAGRKPLSGSCGGVPNALGEQVDDDYQCPVCGDNPNKCSEYSRGE